MIKLGVISLGCDKNRVDTEKFLFSLADKGYEITSDYASAEVIIINTCAFISSAREESIDTILGVAEYKKSGNLKVLVVTGCLPQKYMSDLRDGLPEVDLFLGVDEYAGLDEKLNALLEKVGLKTDNAYCPSTHCGNLNRIITTPIHYAYLKIADGCDNHCTYCTIPSIRGRYRSVPMEELVAETQELAQRGVKELILVAQDCTAYGRDIYNKPSLSELVRQLIKTDIQLIRLMYCYPESVTDELISLISSEPKVAKFIDIPLQHVDTEVLRRMGRRENYETICELIRKIKAASGNIAIRTTFMVGFPGETKEQFNRLCEFEKEYKLDHVGIFAYSPEEDTPSIKLSEQISDKEKMRRVNKLGKIHFENAKRANRQLIGKTLKVIYEDVDYDRQMFRGRTERSAPEIDNYVYFKADDVDVGNYYDIYITGFDGYDLIGEKR